MGTSPCNYFFGAVVGGLLAAGKGVNCGVRVEPTQSPVIETLAHKPPCRVCENRAVMEPLLRFPVAVGVRLRLCRSGTVPSLVANLKRSRTS
jgi:hypothetical protein